MFRQFANRCAIAPMSNSVVSFGKHKGLTYAEVYGSDPHYCKWIIGAHAAGRANRALTDFATYCQSMQHAYLQPTQSQSPQSQSPQSAISPRASPQSECYAITMLQEMERSGMYINSYRCSESLRSCSSVDDLAKVLTMMEARGVQVDEYCEWAIVKVCAEQGSVMDKMGALQRLKMPMDQKYLQYFLKTSKTSEEIVACLDAVKKYNIQADEFLGSRIAEAYFRLNDHSAAMNAMESFDSYKGFERVLVYCASKGLHDAATNIVSMLKKRGYGVSDYQLAQVMRSFIKAKKFDAAKQVYEASSEVEKGRYMESALLDVHCSAGDTAQAEKEFELLDEVHNEDANNMLKMYADQGDGDKAEKLFAQLADGIPNAFSYNSMMRIHLRAKNPERTQHWFQQAQKADCCDGWTYLFMMRAQQKKADVARVFDEMLQNKPLSEVNSRHREILCKEFGFAYCRQQWPGAFPSS
eukprot:GEMP01022187.1.p1 GENE.GEMP01022187.1~~GEMP01022187.1.p1  ORF type:complete len:468 (+),score=105.66 GEMP01022187.1:57-1460(+)